MLCLRLAQHSLHELIKHIHRRRRLVVRHQVPRAQQGAMPQVPVALPVATPLAASQPGWRSRDASTRRQAPRGEGGAGLSGCHARLQQHLHTPTSDGSPLCRVHQLCCLPVYSVRGEISVRREGCPLCTHQGTCAADAKPSRPDHFMRVSHAKFPATPSWMSNCPCSRQGCLCV